MIGDYSELAVLPAGVSTACWKCRPTWILMVRLSDDGEGTKSWMMENASGRMAMTRWGAQVRTLHARVSPSNDTEPSCCLGESEVEVSGDLDQAL